MAGVEAEMGAKKVYKRCRETRHISPTLRVSAYSEEEAIAARWLRQVRCAFFTMDSAVLGLAGLGGGCCNGVECFQPWILRCQPVLTMASATPRCTN
jgi:hypothetical protein